MKELSIEQKAKAYDEALKVTKNLIGAGLIYEDAAIQIFPELAMSDDEKYCERFYCCLRNSRFTETIIDKTQKGE